MFLPSTRREDGREIKKKRGAVYFDLNLAPHTPTNARKCSRGMRLGAEFEALEASHGKEEDVVSTAWTSQPSSSDSEQERRECGRSASPGAANGGSGRISRLDSNVQRVAHPYLTPTGGGGT